MNSVRDDHALARDLATEAGERLLQLRARHGFTDARALRDAGDRLAHVYLVDALGRLRPTDAVLSEEGRDDPRRLTANRVWIVDPLDGTREFAEAGRSDWAVHVALWRRADTGGAARDRTDRGAHRAAEAGDPAGCPESGGEPRRRGETPAGELVAGAVALPAQGRTLSTAAPPLLPAVPGPGEGRPLRIAVSRTRPPEFVDRLAARLDAELVPIGSAGAKIAAVVLGEVDAYVHAGGQYEWDSAAPVAVARAAGVHCSRIDGAPLVYNQADPKLPDILVCRPQLASTLLGGVRAVLAGNP